jgi:TldD protein
MRRAGLLLSLMLLGCTSLLAQGKDVVIKAMKDEMARSIGKLRLSELDKPYFIVYRVADTKNFTISATLGALTQSQTNKGRNLSVDVKVGDYSLDNTNFVNTKELGMRMASLGSNFSSVTLDDDYLQVRRALWRSTDSEYKDAAEKLAAKRSVLQNRQGSKLLPDFEKAPPVESLEPRAEMKIDVAAIEALVRKASAQFKSDPNVLNSSVGVVIRQQYVRYLNSEGTLMTFNEPMVTFAATASTQAKDGTPLSDTMMRFASSTEELDEAKLLNEVKTLAERLSGLRTAKSLDRYNGPVLFEGQAAGQLMAQVFAPAIVASRFPMSDEPQFETQIRQFLGQMGGASLSDRMGARVLPEWIDVIDRPREKQWNGVSTLGSALYDDEGVATRDTTIVWHGVLKAMLATRIPSEEASTTTGSAHGLGASPSNLYTVARKTLPEAELRKQLLAMAKERGFDYGIVVRDVGLAGLSWVRRMNTMSDNNGISQATGTGIYKVFADGHEEQIRDVEFAPVTTSSLKEIVAAGDKPVLHESPFIPMMGSILALAGGGGLGGNIEHVTSFITPSLLVDDLTLKHTDTPAPNGPTVASPLVTQTAMK